MEFTAEFELEDEPEMVKTVYESIKEERKAEEEAVERDKRSSSVEITLKGNTVCVRIGSDDIIRLRAATNTWLRLLKIAEEMADVVRACDSQSL